MDDLTRRDLLKKAGAVAAIGAIPGFVKAESPLPASARWQGANDKIVVGLIGCGGMGASNMRSMMEFPDVQVAAVCDVDSDRMPGDIKSVTDKYGRAPAVFSDYRKMLERKDIDVIIVGSPDHWHALNLIHTCQAGKDAYCEKPISHNLTEAKKMVSAAQSAKRVVQIGTWQRSTQEFADAIAYIRAGKLGKIVHCRAWIADGTRLGKGKVTTPPKNIDFDMWVGPAKMFPYKQNMVHWNWRWVKNTGGGLTTDWGVHMMDIALLGMSKDQDLVMPKSISAQGGLWSMEDDDRDAPDTIEAILRFDDPTFMMTWSVLRDHPGKPGHGTEFISADGKTLRVWRGGWVVLDADGKEIPKESTETVPSHWRNFLDCVKSREKPRADIASVAQTTITCHLVNCSLYSGETVHFDKSKMDIIGGAGKNTLAYNREYRKPYSF